MFTATRGYCGTFDSADGYHCFLLNILYPPTHPSLGHVGYNVLDEYNSPDEYNSI